MLEEGVAVLPMRSNGYHISFNTTIAYVKPANITFRAVNTVGMSMSPFTYQQVVAHAGQRWECDVTLPAMARADAEQWVAFLVSLRGQFGTFTLGDPVGASPRGSAGGTPLVNGASQTGGTLK